ncbi:helix-turn-helix domain-containing protein [Carboxylicivirga sp. RSCT41]|uniref:helix-turn-helix domain-containing protein n=1 Tax=Carboxylicivirga agarovorans TaxID=3417570 RepID=UPI003D336855
MRPDNKTIAVLPFVNMSSIAENEYFSDGITEEIINALARIKGLKVTSRTSSFFFKNKNVPIREIGQTLQVSTILEGSVRLHGAAMRITAQLIQAEDDFHFWSETWDRQLADVFAVQDEISLLIADKLREHFGHFEIQTHLARPQTDNITAYDYSLRANYLRNKWNPEDVTNAITLFEKALKCDPQHSESYLGLADSYSFLGTTGFMPYQEAWEKTKRLTNKALQLNDQSSGVHYQLSNQAFFIDCDYNRSLKEMARAIEINPNNAEAQQFMSFLYLIAGQNARAKKHLDMAIAINPLSDETRFFNAYYHYMLEDYDKALDLLNNCLEVNDKNIPAHSIKSLCLLKLERYNDVLDYYDTIPSEVVIQGEKTGAKALAYACLKDQANVSLYLEQLRKQSREENGFTADSYLFLMYAVLEEYDRAFEWLEKALADKASLLMLRFTDPLARCLKSDDRYAGFHQRIYLSDYEAEPGTEKKPLLSDEVATTYATRLLEHIELHKPYLDPDLSIRLLAEQLKMHPNQLSWLLNETLGKNFNQFINHYRVEAFKLLARDPACAHLTLLGLAYESGFNSKTVFNTYFKKETGLTPGQYLKEERESADKQPKTKH